MRARITKRSANRLVERDAGAKKKPGTWVRMRDATEERRRVDHSQAEEFRAVREK
jgi:hypothetical protein